MTFWMGVAIALAIIDMLLIGANLIDQCRTVTRLVRK